MKKKGKKKVKQQFRKSEYTKQTAKTATVTVAELSAN